MSRAVGIKREVSRGRGGENEIMWVKKKPKAGQMVLMGWVCSGKAECDLAVCGATRAPPPAERCHIGMNKKEEIAPVNFPP